MGQDLEFTGERFIPGTAGEIWHEHWHRYHFAAPLVAGLDVLDVACGEGYGSALLATRAATVIGADIAPSAVEHARARYAAVANLEFRQADCAALPFADASFDAVVSFETIEHITAQEAFLDEIRRVLRPDGLLILSCPNKAEYTDRRGVTNEFHVRELYRAELAALIASRFAHAVWYGQRPSFYSVVWPEQGAEPLGEIFEVSEASATSVSPGHARPLYFIVIASASGGAARGHRAARVGARRSRRMGARGLREGHARPHCDASPRPRSRRLSRAGARGARRRSSGSMRSARARRRASARALPRKIERQQHEIARRASVSWWLALPVRRAWLALTGKRPWD